MTRWNQPTRNDVIVRWKPMMAKINSFSCCPFHELSRLRGMLAPRWNWKEDKWLCLPSFVFPWLRSFHGFVCVSKGGASIGECCEWLPLPEFASLPLDCYRPAQSLAIGDGLINTVQIGVKLIDSSVVGTQKTVNAWQTCQLFVCSSFE